VPFALSFVRTGPPSQHSPCSWNGGMSPPSAVFASSRRVLVTSFFPGRPFFLLVLRLPPLMYELSLLFHLQLRPTDWRVSATFPGIPLPLSAGLFRVKICIVIIFSVVFWSAIGEFCPSRPIITLMVPPGSSDLLCCSHPFPLSAVFCSRMRSFFSLSVAEPLVPAPSLGVAALVCPPLSVFFTTDA